MADSVHIDKEGPIWNLGLVLVPTPGTPVSIMSLVNAAIANSLTEYAVRGCQLLFRGVKKNTHGCQNNSGNVYIIRKFGTAGGRDDYGSIVDVIPTGTLVSIPSVPAFSNVLNPYDIYIDADNANDGAIVTMLVSV